MANSPKSSATVMGGLLLIVLTLGAGAWFFWLRQGLEPGTSRGALPVLSRVPEFNLTNQLGQPVSRRSLLGKVWVADIIFTRCAGPCPKMTRQMSQLQAELPETDVRLVTLTTDPAYDTPQVLQRYSQRFGARAERWWFLTGTPSEIARLALEGLKLTAVEVQPTQRKDEADLFIHGTLFVVVDKQGRLRAAVETQDEPLTEEEAVSAAQGGLWDRESKRRLLRIIGQLLKEP